MLNLGSSIEQRDDFITSDDMFVQLILGFVIDLFSIDGGEVCGDAVVVVLFPDIEGVVVAFRALHANAEEDLGGGLGSDKRVAMRSMEGSGRVVVGTADTGQELSHPFTDWSIARRLCSKPVVQQPCAFGAHYFLFVSDQVAPTHGPHEIEIGICEKSIYPLVDFVLIRVLNERFGFVDRR